MDDNKRFEAERDSGLRSTILQWTKRDLEQESRVSWHMGKELYVPDNYWDEFVDLVNRLDIDKRANKKLVELLRERDKYSSGL